jgi:hypothetical protein
MVDGDDSLDIGFEPLAGEDICVDRFFIRFYPYGACAEVLRKLL